MSLVALALGGVIAYSILADTNKEKSEFDEFFDPNDVAHIKNYCKESGYSQDSLNRILKILLHIGTISEQEIQQFEQAYYKEWQKESQKYYDNIQNEYDKMVKTYHDFNKNAIKDVFTYTCTKYFYFDEILKHDNDYAFRKVANDVYNNTIWNEIAMREARIIPKNKNTPYRKEIEFKQVWGIELYENFPYSIEEIYKLCVQQQGYKW